MHTEVPIDVAFIFLMYVDTRKAIKRNGIPQLGSARKKTIAMEVSVKLLEIQL